LLHLISIVNQAVKIWDIVCYCLDWLASACSPFWRAWS